MVIVGVLLAVLLGLAGMAVDLGAVYAERRELRTGADAAALAIAEDCGRGTQACDDATATRTAEQYAAANSHDGSATVESVTLTMTGSSTGSVRVVTSAWDAAAGKAGVRVPLLSLLGFDRVAVGAAATAVFDHPRSGAGIPVIIDTCEFFEADGYGPLHTITLTFHAPSSTDPPPVNCPSDPAHKDFPGGFGYTEVNVADACATETAVGVWVPGDPGNDLPQDCKDKGGLFLENLLYNRDILVPLYSGIDPRDKEYLVAGWGAFHVTAYSLGSKDYTRPRSFKCPGSPADRCLQGYFTRDTVYYGEAGGEDFGVVLVKLTE